MSKKKSKGRVKSKAAQATAATQRGQKGTRIPPPRSGGLMTKMRSGFQSAAGSTDTTKPPSIMQRALWFVVIAAAVFFFARGL